MSIFAAIILFLVSAISAVACPLATYTFTLATFGLTHVLTELHYVNHRFHQRLGNSLRLRISQLLLLVICFRILQVFGLIPTWLSISLELSCVVGLVSLVIPILAKKDWRLGVLGTILCVILAVGIFWSATLTLLLFAILHNITPVGFIAEKLRGWQRNRALFACAVVFFLVPLVILSGIPYKFLSSMGLVTLEASLFPVGGLEFHLGAFVPKQLHNQVIAIHAFSAAVFLQSMHYAVVIGVLPKWDNANQCRTSNRFLTYYEKKHFRWFVTFLSALLFVGFTISFINTRAVYGIVAAVHAWVEIPILLLALAIPEESKVNG
ncbi:hypothetical protein NIES37_67290 [Tolypothrix tenuis PCC 7101]|uniref:Uncharacterized protein n=1 Tax=Tolypothrix tenuis PCC 7101 TaxID=231146 RepID=A0A1Z4NAJ9_9CYAN|nr:hypothetical protein [Aulosira sp. FACHB-113]BAZ02716.1 hypothetical protein NIES37_67290 [Tolypothrix tenuis PCC 7101]BAZ78391.1 hypothetical protein NIES50_70240 [Aulosira laxa NIES-50]